jgi:hypothetical protein
MKLLFTIFFLLIFSLFLFSQPILRIAPNGTIWVKTSTSVVTNGAAGYTGNASGNLTPGTACGTNTSCGGNDTSLGWNMLCGTVPASTVGTPGNIYVQKQLFGNVGQNNTNNPNLANLSLTCNPAAGSPNWPSTTSETRKAVVPHWLNPKKDMAGTAILGEEIYLPTKTELEILDDGVGNGSGTGADELRFTILGGNSGQCSEYFIRAKHDLKLNVADSEFNITANPIIPTVSVEQTLSGVPDAGSGNSYNATDNNLHNNGCGSFLSSANSWYFNGGNQSAFGTGVGSSSGGGGVRKLFPNNGTIKQDGSNFDVLFTGNFELELFRNWGNADARATISPGMGGKARVVATYDVWTLQAVLPITLLSFDVRSNNQYSEIYWTTASEINNDYFEIQRSDNGIQWKNIGTVKGNGNTKSPKEYHFTDQTPITGKNYYRLCQYDFDGKKSLSAVKIINNNKKTVEIFPNPIQNGKTQLYLEENKIVRIFDTQGQLLRTWAFEIETADIVTLDLSSFPIGVYFIQAGDSYVSRLIKND